jgi:hypothetical protein
MRQRTSMLVLDPPVPIDPEMLGLQTVGMKMVERNGVYHLMDWVGVNHYPNVADFVEEAIRIGVSRRVPSNIRIDLLTEDSRLLLVHERAQLDGRADMLRNGPFRTCPMGRDEHNHSVQGMVNMCARFWWDDLEGGTEVQTGGREVVRALADGHSYGGRRRLLGTAIPERMPAIFASLKLARFAVIVDRQNRTHEALEARLDSQDVRYVRADG